MYAKTQKERDSYLHVLSKWELAAAQWLIIKWVSTTIHYLIRIFSSTVVELGVIID